MMYRLVVVALVVSGCGAGAVSALAATMVRVNVDPSGGQTGGAGPFARVLVSADGRFVVFSSPEARLVAGDTNGESDVFVRDIAAKATERLSVTSTGAQTGGGDLLAASPGARYVAFTSCSFNLLPPGVSGCRLYLRDRVRGVTRFIPRADGECAAVSSDGRYIAYTVLDRRAEVRDRRRGSVERVSVPPPGIRFGTFVRVMGISAGGRYVLFLGVQPDLHAGPRSHLDVWVRDRLKSRTIAVNVSSAERAPNGTAWPEAISADGRYVMFDSLASNLVPGDTNGVEDVFVRDLMRGTTHRISVSTRGRQGDNTSIGAGLSFHGRYRLFLSNAHDLVSGDTNHHRDLFLRDRATGVTRRINLSPSGRQANNATWSASLSQEGGWVSFVSAADNLVPGDTNKYSDIFLRGPLH